MIFLMNYGIIGPNKIESGHKCSDVKLHFIMTFYMDQRTLSRFQSFNCLKIMHMRPLDSVEISTINVTIKRGSGKYLASNCEHELVEPVGEHMKVVPNTPN
jgi:hypothetical protein